MDAVDPVSSTGIVGNLARDEEGIVTLIFAHDHPCLAGHFPDNPLIPGALLLSHAQQSIERASGTTLAGLANAKFLQPVRAEQRLTLHYQITPKTQRVTFTYQCSGTLMATGQFLLAAH